MFVTFHFEASNGNRYEIDIRHDLILKYLECITDKSKTEIHLKDTFHVVIESIEQVRSILQTSK